MPVKRPPQPPPPSGGFPISEKTPLEPFQLRYIPPQARAHTTEARNDLHPWLIACSDAVLDWKLFVGPLVTHALERHDNPKLNCYYKLASFERNGKPYNPKARRARFGQTKWSDKSYIDSQNIWTFTLDHDDTRTPAATLVSPSREEVCAELRSRFTLFEGRVPAPEWSVGRICSVTLDRSQIVRTSDGSVDFRHGDVFTLKKLLPDWLMRDTALPCVIVASDQPKRAEGKTPWKAVTVVPLVDASAFPKRYVSMNPIVTVPPRPGQEDRPDKMTALTLLLFSVGYDEADPTTRLKANHEAFPLDYEVPAAELQPILNDIHRIIG